jgi:hypothetical protein
MYRRKAYERPLDWKAKGGRTAMLIEGTYLPLYMAHVV